MADPILTQPPSYYLLAESPEAGTAFRAMRDGLLAAGPLDPVTCELIVISGLSTAGFEYSFKHHSRRLLAMGAPMAALRQAVMLPLGATAALFEVARGLEWLNQLEEELAAADAQPGTDHDQGA